MIIFKRGYADSVGKSPSRPNVRRKARRSVCHVKVQERITCSWRNQMTIDLNAMDADEALKLLFARLFDHMSMRVPKCNLVRAPMKEFA